MEWLIVVLALLALLVTALVVDNRNRARHKPLIKKDYVYQEPMLQRHTDKRKQETRLALSEWEVEFTKLDALLSIQYVVNTGSFVPIKVLEFAKKTDPKLYAKLQEHNDNLQYRLEMRRYASYWEEI